MREHDKTDDGDAFEKYLFRVYKEGSRKIPVTSKDLNRPLGSSVSDEDLLFQEKMVSAMKGAHERRKDLERKIKDMSLIHSFGELLRILVEFYRISIVKFAQALGVSKDDFDLVLMDKKPPENLEKEHILNIAALFEISISNIVAILERTIKLSSIDKTTFAGGQARSERGLSEANRNNLMNDAMKELLLKIEDSKENPKNNITWEEFKDVLREKSLEDESPFNRFKECYTMNSTSDYYVALLIKEIQ